MAASVTSFVFFPRWPLVLGLASFLACSSAGTVGDGGPADGDADGSALADGGDTGGDRGGDGGDVGPIDEVGTYFDWGVRRDRDGRPAGIYESTPYPIDEAALGRLYYEVKNDEHPSGRRFYLGASADDIVFADGRLGDDCDGASYSPAERACSASGAYRAFDTIGEAVEAAGSGNRSVVIREGTYDEQLDLDEHLGQDGDHRFTLVGYGQERPVLEGASAGAEDPILKTNTTTGEAFITYQRLKLQNNAHRGVLNRRDELYMIDVEIENCVNQPGNTGDGNVVFYDSSDCWLHHCTSHHTYGHCYKLSDAYADGWPDGTPSDGNILEWSVGYECGYWQSGYDQTAYFGHHSAGLDFPQSDGQREAHGHIVRYNIVHDVLAHCVQMRNVEGFSLHHNEIYGCIRGKDALSDYGEHFGYDVQVLVYGTTNWQSSGEIAANVIRDPGSGSVGAIRVSSSEGAEQPIRIFNNLFYGDFGSAPAVHLSAGTSTLFANNSVYAGSSDTVLREEDGASCTLVNNIVYQSAQGACARLMPETDDDFNLYFFPGGSLGEHADGAHDQLPAEQDFWIALPEGAYGATEAALDGENDAVDRGTGLDGIFDQSFNGVPRPCGAGWDIGACEYCPGG
ncbi:MAG: hypothetical protein JXR96_09625 [Deltaproteobacteria bacterium]|nr:hypothetical protein [Deltaproteobacteria bacterium]